MRLDGLLRICRLENVSVKGRMPQEQLVTRCSEYYERRTVGVTRYYAALGADKQVDMVLRIWRNTSITIKDYAVLEDSSQYRIVFIQELLNDDGLEVMDLTLEALEKNYDLTGDID